MRIWGMLLGSAVAIPALCDADEPVPKGGGKDYVKILSAEVRGKLRLPDEVAIGHPAGITAYVEVWGYPLYWLDFGGNDALRKRASGWKDGTVVMEGPVEIRPAVDAGVSLPPGVPRPVVSVLVPRSLKVAEEKK